MGTPHCKCSYCKIENALSSRLWHFIRNGTRSQGRKKYIQSHQIDVSRAIEKGRLTKFATRRKRLLIELRIDKC